MLKISVFYLDKQKVLFLKKICGMLVLETLKCRIYDFLISNNGFYSRLYGMYILRENFPQLSLNSHSKIGLSFKKVGLITFTISNK